jgi:hypothetical protein
LKKSKNVIAQNACHLPFENDWNIKMSIYHTHIYGLCLKRPHLWHENYQILQMVHKQVSNYVKSHMKWILKNHKNKKSFQSFLEYICN